MRARYVHLVCLWLCVGLLAADTPTTVAARPSASGGHQLPATLAGAATVLDGDSIQIGEVRLRLEGIDAPELGQTCGRALAGSWACGTAAKSALERMTSGLTVTCTAKSTDHYGRLLARCMVGSVDLNARLVAEGLAWAFVKYSNSYVDVEAEARARRVGIWQGDAEPPWTFRERRWTAEAPIAPSGCAIKGKITRNGQIYHTPWSPWYAVSRIDERRGERWFCSEAEAVAAGWRPAGVKW